MSMPNTVTMISVPSSNISRIGFDADSKTLYVEFVSNGTTWAYSPVPVSEFNALLHAPSFGKQFHARIRGRYSEEQVG